MRLLQKSNDNNPWGKKPDNQGPPDLEKAIKNFLGRKKKKGSGNAGGGSGGPSDFNFPELKWLAVFFIAIAAIIWALSGIYIVNPPEEAAVQRFGKYVETVHPGMHWYPRFIETVTKVNVDTVDTVTLDREMLTSEENIVHVNFAVQYQVGDIKDYLFNTTNPKHLLSQALDSSVRQVIGQSKLQNILTVSRKEITQKVRKELTDLLDKYQAGIHINEVLMQPARPPEAVKHAFDDVIKAREDREKLQNQAHSYANRVVPKAKGQAKRVLDEAHAYKESLILQAKGDIAQFNQLLPLYEEKPRVIKNQLYFKTMQNVYANNKVFLTEGGGDKNLFFFDNGASSIMPVDKQGEQDNDQSKDSLSNSKTYQSHKNQSSQQSKNVEYLRWLEANQ